MPKKKTPTAIPLTFDLNPALLHELQAEQKRAGQRSVSEIVRAAVAEFDAGSYYPEKDKHRQVSVRIPDADRRKLVRTAKARKVSIGEVVRAALAQHLQ